MIKFKRCDYPHIHVRSQPRSQAVAQRQAARLDALAGVE